jgi:hypothetical protein
MKLHGDALHFSQHPIAGMVEDGVFTAFAVHLEEIDVGEAFAMHDFFQESGRGR